MSELGTYTFLPWLRQGIATEITRVDGTTGSISRAQVLVGVDIAAGGATRSTQVTLDLHGPGEIIGFDPRMIVRLDPRAGVQDAEPNYFPAVEFHEPDFPWRYTPARATGENRLRPWLLLVVLDFADIKAQRPATADGHLAELTVDSASLLPDLSQSWAWAHAQIAALTPGESAQAILDREPQRTVSRLLCPIALRPSTPYRAFLVPAFERGRLAGLKLPIDTPTTTIDALAPAWIAAQGTVTLPVYFSWDFSTGTEGDFEHLVRKLAPRVIRDVGQRKMDVSAPDPSLPPAASNPLDMEGALKALGLEPAPWPGDERAQFLDGNAERPGGLRALLNRPQDLLESGVGAPIVAPPLYGRWHGKQNRLHPGQPPAWFNVLNQDPTLRSSASLGTTVVQRQQEQLMASAWEQLDEVLATNEKLRQVQLSRELAEQVKTKFIDVLDDDAVISVTSPVHRRLLASPVTFHALAQDARVQYFGVGTLRRVTRARGTVARRLKRFAAAPSKLFARANDGKIRPAPAPITPKDLQTRKKAGEALAPSSATAGQLRWQGIAPIVLLVIAIVLVVAALVAGASPLALALAAGAAVALGAAALGLQRARGRLLVAAGFRDGTLTADDIRRAVPASGFVPMSGQGFGDLPAAPAGTQDPPGTAAFKVAMAALAEQMFAAPPLEKAPVPLEIPTARRRLSEQLNPRINHVIAMRERLQVASWVDRKPRDPLDRVMASPEFEQPMYEPLRDLSQEFLLPGVGTIPENTTGLLLTNQRFVEAYMAGLNHEMARELLWREYPTDQRGTCFRQFWDVRGYVSDPPRDPATLLDIKRMHEWQDRALGANSARTPPPGGAHLVLIVRGQVLKRYPTTRVYAVQAVREADGTLTLGATESHPVFGGTLEPDVSFFGFELTKEQVRGQPGSASDLGWFFVLQQQPTEPRFGLDIADPATAGSSVGASWDDLSWGHLVDDIDDLSGFGHIDLTGARPDVQFTDTSAAKWHAAAGTDAAQLAYITMQKPFRVAIHGASMVPT